MIDAWKSWMAVTNTLIMLGVWSTLIYIILN